MEAVRSLVSKYFDSTQPGIQYKQTIDYWSSNMLSFDFLEKGLRIVSPPHFVYGFLRKCFLCYTLLTVQISLPDYVYFFASCFTFTLVNMGIAIVC